jgi:hypothetical protein
MPQLSLYIDKDTLSRIEVAAELEHLSISKYVVSKLNETLTNSWPANYENLFGSIVDETFEIESVDDFTNDTTREEL